VKFARWLALFLQIAVLSAAGWDARAGQPITPGFDVLVPPKSREIFGLSLSNAPPSIGLDRLLYMRVSFPDFTNEPISEVFASNLMRQVDAVYRTNSFGLLSITSTITPLLQLPFPRSNYVTSAGWNPWDIWNATAAAARAAGFNPDDYELAIARFDAPIGRSYGDIGRKGVWMTISTVRDTAHEIGHNLGLHHANSWSGSINGAGTNIEYGNQFDLMGQTADAFEAQFSAYAKRQLGWLSPDNTPKVTASGVYRLWADDSGGKSPEAIYGLRIRKDEEREYWIEKRMDPFNEALVDSVLVYWAPWEQSNLGTQLLDMNSKYGEPLPVGMRFSDPVAGVQIIPLQRAPDGSWVDVAIILGVEDIIPAALYLLPRNGSGNDILYFSGGADSPLHLQSSTDLAHWADQESVPSGTPGSFWNITPDQRFEFFRVH
jgi:hypothetical protein